MVAPLPGDDGCALTWPAAAAEGGERGAFAPGYILRIVRSQTLFALRVEEVVAPSLTRACTSLNDALPLPRLWTEPVASLCRLGVANLRRYLATVAYLVQETLDGGGSGGPSVICASAHLRFTGEPEAAIDALQHLLSGLLWPQAYELSEQTEDVTQT